MISTNILNLKTPSQDAQGHWYELLSPTQVLTGQQQPQEHGEEKKKKKCRGNRTAQRLRRRLRQRGIDPDIIAELVNQRINPQQQQHNEALQNDQIPQSTQHKDKYDNSTVKKSIKRKRNETSSNTIDKSLSQLSISQPSPKKQKMVNNEIKQ
ncbi:unnamed protein product, partial [Rotaria sordida]